MTILTTDFYSRHFGKLVFLAWLAGAVLLLASAFVGRGSSLMSGDSVHYYEYARSLVYEGRLPDRAIAYPCGTAILGLPGAVAGRVAGVIAGVGPDGRHLVQEWLYCLGLSLYGVIALHLNVAMLLRLGFNRPSACTAVFFAFVASNIGFYILKEPAMSECATYFAVSLFYHRLVSMRTGTPTVRDFVMLGFILGFAFAIRQQNILHAVAIPFALLGPAWRQSGPAGTAARALATVATCALPMMLPYLAWYAATGRFQAAQYSHVTFDFLRPHLWDVLFTFKYHGLFTWGPVFLLAIPGWWAFADRDRWLTAAFLVPAVLQLYIIASWLSWWFGDGFGNRGFFTIYPALLPGLALTAARFVGRRRERGFVSMLVTLTLINIVLMAAIATGRLPTNPEIWEDWGWWPL